jgi:hypothetical protein
MSSPHYHPDGSAPTPGDWIFVFGSNSLGQHYGGAARFAHERFGAPMGEARGLRGSSYAIATCERPGTPGSFTIEQVAEQVQEFVGHVQANPDKRYWLTRVGCGLAGFGDSRVAPLFKELASLGERVSFPEDWEIWVEEQPA